jgi:AbrB family looped-hinge helix DNA binding protein
MKSVMSTKGQTVIPKEIRDALGLKPGTKLAWSLNDRSVTVIPIPSDPVGALRGLLKDSGYTYDDFLRERNEERERERQADEEEAREYERTSRGKTKDVSAWQKQKSSSTPRR